MRQIAGIEKTTANLRKCLRPSEILQSNKVVEALMKTMHDHFTHPFDNHIYGPLIPSPMVTMEDLYMQPG